MIDVILNNQHFLIYLSFIMVITGILKEKGYTIARRTVAKYREQLDLPVARLRKEL